MIGFERLTVLKIYKYWKRIEYNSNKKIVVVMHLFL